MKTLEFGTIFKFPNPPFGKGNQAFQINMTGLLLVTKLPKKNIKLHGLNIN